MHPRTKLNQSEDELISAQQNKIKVFAPVVDFVSPVASKRTKIQTLLDEIPHDRYQREMQQFVEDKLATVREEFFAHIAAMAKKREQSLFEINDIDQLLLMVCANWQNNNLLGSAKMFKN